MIFESEKQMSLYMYEFLKEHFDEECIDYFWEFEGLFGRPDYLIVEKNLNTLDYSVAIELKLKNWRQALKQAFRYRNFSNESYVVLDMDSIGNALKYLETFAHYNVGLASFNKCGEFKIYYEPRPSEPFSDYFTKLVEDEVFLGNKDVTGDSSDALCNKSINILFEKFRCFNSNKVSC